MLLVGGRKGIRPVKKLHWWDAGMVICLGRDADLHMAHLMPLPLTISCSSRFRLVLLPGFTFLIPAHPGSSGHSPGGHKTVVVVVVVLLLCTVRISRVLIKLVSSFTFLVILQGH